MKPTLKIILGAIIFMLSCISDRDELRSKIIDASRDKEIDKTEWIQLLGLAKGTDFEDCDDLSDYIKKITEKRGVPAMPDCKKLKIPKPVDLSIFIENSGSMSGYFNGATEFKDVLMAIPNRVQGKEGHCKFFFITKDPKEISNDYQGYIKKLHEGPKHIDLNQSHIDALIAKVSEAAVKENCITLLASDFIYDVGAKLPGDQLPVVQHAITNSMQKYLKNGDYGVLVLKMKSSFNGKYYGYKSIGITVVGERPYYIWLFGKSDELINIFNTLNLHNLKGIEDYLFVYKDKVESDIFYSVLPLTNLKGKFNREKGAKQFTHKLEHVKLDERSKFLQFSLAVDLANIPAAKNYFLNKENFQIESTGKDRFEIVSVMPIDKVTVHKNDQKFQGSATHILILKTETIKEENQTLKIRLLKNMPEWIEKSSTNDDTDINNQLNKTFGLKYIMQGLMDAYFLPGKKSSFAQFELQIIK